MDWQLLMKALNRIEIWQEKELLMKKKVENLNVLSQSDITLTKSLFQKLVDAGRLAQPPESQSYYGGVNQLSSEAINLKLKSHSILHEMNFGSKAKALVSAEDLLRNHSKEFPAVSSLLPGNLPNKKGASK